jgi:signal transduction histidine kinase
MRRGAIDFLSKPIELKALLAAIKDALRLRQARLGPKRDESLPTLEKFFPFLAHEIRNPLHAIGGALAVIQRRADLQDEPLARSVQIIKEEVHHLTDFVQECLDFVRPVNRRVFTEININELLAVVLNIAHHIFAEDGHKIKVTTDFTPGLPAIQANYDELKQAFLNIVKNNFEAMLEQGGELQVISKGHPDPEPGWVEVRLIDQGPGINAENVRNIFVPFFTTKLKGTGLGLPICHRIIVERHGGRIDVESEEGQGTRIAVHLPVR